MDPNDDTHTDNGKPRFIIQILNRFDVMLDEVCGFADFSAGVNTEGWHSTKQPDINGTIRDVYYKDWTTLGINLSEYSGRIQIMAMDISPSIAKKPPLKEFLVTEEETKESLPLSASITNGLPNIQTKMNGGKIITMETTLYVQTEHSFRRNKIPAHTPVA